MSQTKQPQRNSPAAGPSKSSSQSSASHRGPSKPLPGSAPSPGRSAQRKVVPPPPPEPRPLYIWFAAALVPLVILLAWVLWPKGTPVSTIAPGASRSMVIETDKGRIVARLYTAEEANVPEWAQTIDQLTEAANRGNFNGRTFYQVDWALHGGEALDDGSGLKARYNKLPFKAGSLGMWRGPDPSENSDSQFFILLDESMSSDLTGKYTNFGEVVEGMDVARKIAVGDKINRVTVVENP